MAALVVVTREELRETVALLVEQALAAAGREVPWSVVLGGEQRRDSVRHGLDALPDPAPPLTLVHDAARPLADPELFDRVADGAARTGGSIPAVAVVDSLKRRGVRQGQVEAVPRDGLFAVQTPQGFRTEVLRRAHAQQTEFEATDDAMLVEALGEPIELVEGARSNLKVTLPGDLAIARALLGESGEVRSGFGKDLHRLQAGGPLWIGGVALDEGVEAVGHSDGDVVLHAITDAILGAIVDRDIGQHFSDRDPANRGRTSSDFIAEALRLARASGWTPVHVDTVVTLERPKLSPYRDQVRQRVASMLEMPVTRVSLKAKTHEGLGVLGRGRAIACDALVQLGPWDGN